MIEQIINLVSTLWPFRVVTLDELGVYVVLSRKYWRVKPGIYPVIPFFIEVHCIGSTEQVCDFPEMALTTKDHKGILLDGTISYTITDQYKALFEVADLDETIQSRTMGALCDAVSRFNRKDIITQDKIKTAVCEDMDELQEQFGFEITQIDITTNIQAIGIYLSK